jgi:endoglucanase
MKATSPARKPWATLVTSLLAAAQTALAADPGLALVAMSGLAGGGTRLTFQVSGDPGPKWLEGSRDFQTWEAFGPARQEVVFEESATVAAADGYRFFRTRTQAGSPPNELEARAADTTSTSVRLAWTPPAGATATRVYLAPEPDLAASANPARKLLTDLPGSTTEFTAAGLAAAVDCFFRIETDAPGGAKAAVVHARTPRGPKTVPGVDAVPQPKLREVHGFAPNILCVTLANWATNQLKESWAVVRADGTPLSIRAVHRHSVPVGTPRYPLDPAPPDYPGQEHWSGVIETDHRMFLEFTDPVGPATVLTITGPNNFQCLLPFSDRYLETPVIQLNQVGYNPRATQRWAYVSGWMGDGGPLSLTTFPTAAEVLREPENPLDPRTTALAALPVTLRSAMDVTAGTPVHELDLAALPTSETARYRVRLPGVGVSWPTAVSERAAFKAFYTVARGLFHNRWGGDLRPDLTEWSRPADHPTVFTAESTRWLGSSGWPYTSETPRLGSRSLQGGHHDAGDFDIRPFHTIVAQLLLRTYEIGTNTFVDGQLNLPESGNGIPDLLDEALWSLQAWEQLQEEDGGVRLGVESYDHPPNQGVLAHLDPLPYWTYARDASHSARCAGLFAQAARLLGPFDPARAEQLKQRAIRAFDYAAPRFPVPSAALYAVGELLRLTGEARFGAALQDSWQSVGGDELGLYRSSANQQGITDYMLGAYFPADHLLSYVLRPNPSPDVARWLDEDQDNPGQLSHEARIQAQFTESRDAHRNPRPQHNRLGFGQGASMGFYLQRVVTRLQLGVADATERQQFFNALSLSADYILGGNPLGMVYFTGLGTRHVEEPLHLDSLAFIHLGKGPVPGIPVYGPADESDNYSYTLGFRSAFHPEIGDGDSGGDHTRPARLGHPIGRRYADVRLWVIANEFSVAEMQAPHTQLFALLMLGTQGVLPPASYLPGGADHRNPLP